MAGLKDGAVSTGKSAKRELGAADALGRQAGDLATDVDGFLAEVKKILMAIGIGSHEGHESV